MLTEEQVADFHRDGFLNGGRILDERGVQELKDELDRILSIGPEGFPEGASRPVLFHNMAQGRDPEKCVWQIVNIWEVSSAYERLTRHPFIVDAISRLTNAHELMVWHDQIQYKPAGHGGVTGWHQDAPLWPIIRPMTPVSAWVALDDATVENGCMWMTPGSHKWGNQIEFLRTQAHLQQKEGFGDIEGFTPSEDAEITSVGPRPWTVKAGEVSLHHSLTWHGSPFNHSDQPRRAIAMHYMTGESRFVASGQHVMKAYVQMDDDELMSKAGPHFPSVMKNGQIVQPTG
jgi:ectoine hydroxylase-related dioxygenase (phytanoyl-CoA dioxygenase family)